MDKLWLASLLNLFAYFLLFVSGMDEWLFPYGNFKPPSELNYVVDKDMLPVSIIFSYGGITFSSIAVVFAWLIRKREGITLRKRKNSIVVLTMSVCGLAYGMYLLGRLNTLASLYSSYPSHFRH
jgi:hypothetical protein